MDEAILAILIAAMDANAHVSPEEAWRAHHIIWSMRRFRDRDGASVDRLVDGVRTRLERQGTEEVLPAAARTIPARLRPAVFAVAVDLMLADARLERAEAAFVTDLAGQLKLEQSIADGLVRAMLVKNSA